MVQGGTSVSILLLSLSLTFRQGKKIVNETREIKTTGYEDFQSSVIIRRKFNKIDN